MKSSQNLVHIRLPYSYPSIRYTPSLSCFPTGPEIPNQIPNHIQPAPLPIEIDDELEYEIAEILDSKIDN